MYPDLCKLYCILQKTKFTLFSVILIFGIIENGLVIWIAGFRMKKTINAVWFLNLAITDFLCCTTIPLHIVWDTELIHWRSRYIFEVVMTVSLVIAMSASVLLLTAMSIDRWVSVMLPFWAKVHRTHKLAKIIAGVIWMFCLVVTGVVCSFVVKYVGQITSIEIMDIVDLVRLVVLFVIPFLIISTCYVTIFFKIRKSKRLQRSQRPYRIITAVILCFFICWAPYYTWPFIFRDIYYDDRYIIKIVMYSLVFLNSCINPIIYVFMDQDFRDGFLTSIPFRLKTDLREQPVNTKGSQLSTTTYV
ncbi:hypothetical protein GDO81_025030 [Engystomops pustulosus]|uniref:G-protein coupled receptors family 1 profile domain-containing protein n=1 Tax=Engystomops pustulosus TaxID=76066 RepID=A0AAV6YJ08_ENGPU|nr:hypothetical protein GDO81_025030 [Engystomops pustulosus]